MRVDPRAGKLPATSMLVNVPRLMTAYYTQRPDVLVSEQRVAFGTSGSHPVIHALDQLPG